MTVQAETNATETVAIRFPRALGRQIIVFLIVFAALQLSWQMLQGSVVQELVVNDFTVVAATGFANWLTPTLHAQAIQNSIYSYSGSLNIINGCDGMEALFVLIAAFALAPLPWRSRAFGLLLGLPFVFVVNQIRILALFYANRSDHGLFELLHGTVTPIAVIIFICGYFYAWLRRAHRISPVAA
jgi:exosortase family protein XrtM